MGMGMGMGSTGRRAATALILVLLLAGLAVVWRWFPGWVPGLDAGPGEAQRRRELVQAQAADQNKNGRPDNLDVLEGARQVLRERPRYADRYLALAYPDGDVPRDEAVCTDVVVRAWRAAGYDLQRLVHEDLRAELKRVGGDPSAPGFPYPLRNWRQPAPDANIDHRRVPNLLVYLQRHALRLTTAVTPGDRANLDQWWPGDIVVYDQTGAGLANHIAVVSDRATRGGVPLIIEALPGVGVTEASRVNRWTILGHFRAAP